MSKNVKGTMAVSILAWIIIIFIVVFALRHLGRLAISGLEMLSSPNAVVVVALITGTLSIISISLKGIMENRQETKRYLIEKREASYRKFISTTFKVMRESKNIDGEAHNINNEILDRTVEELWDIFEELTLWGSNRVITRLIIYKKAAANCREPEVIIFMIEDIILAIREDLGYSTKGMKKGDVLRIFINDVDIFLEKRLKNSN